MMRPCFFWILSESWKCHQLGRIYDLRFGKYPDVDLLILPP